MNIVKINNYNNAIMSKYILALVVSEGLLIALVMTQIILKRHLTTMVMARVVQQRLLLDFGTSCIKYL